MSSVSGQPFEVLKGALYLPDGQLKVSNSILVVFQQLPCIVEQGISLPHDGT
jgi:hypothetical protein